MRRNLEYVLTDFRRCLIVLGELECKNYCCPYHFQLLLLLFVSSVAVGISGVLLLTATWSMLTSRSDAPAVTCHKARGAGTGAADSGEAGSGTTCTGDSCPWQYVLSDLTNRLHLLEAAFKEQVRVVRPHQGRCCHTMPRYCRHTSPRYVLSNFTKARVVRPKQPPTSSGGDIQGTGTCRQIPPKYVLSDLTDCMHLLEAAFKEQVRVIRPHQSRSCQISPRYMLSDLTNRLHILEAAFKEQVHVVRPHQSRCCQTSPTACTFWNRPSKNRSALSDFTNVRIVKPHQVTCCQTSPRYVLSDHINSLHLLEAAFKEQVTL